MSPASITAFSTIVFGLTFAPMMTPTPESAPESTPSNGHPQQTLTFDNETAQRGSRREREMYQHTAEGPSVADLQEEDSPYSRRVERETIDISLHPHADRRAAKRESNSRQHTSPSQTRQHRSSANMTRQQTKSHQHSTGQPIYTLSQPLQQQQTSQQTRNAARTHTPRQSKPTQSQPSQHRSNSSSVSATYNASNSASNSASETGSSVPGRRPIDQKAEKIPAPGSNLANAKADNQAKTERDTTKKAAPSASAGKSSNQQ